MSEYKSYFEVKNKTSNRIFGLFISSILILISIYLYYFYSSFNYYLIYSLIIILIISIFFQKILYYPNKLFFIFATKIGDLIGILIMFIIYFTLILPIGLIMRIIDRDFAKNKIYTNKQSYWKYNEEKINFKNQF